MNRYLKRLAGEILPPVVMSSYRKMRAARAYRGRYATWEEACAASSGYDAPAILEKTAAAMALVKAGKAAFARDGVAFPEPDYPYYLLSALLRQAAKDGGRLSVLDFGGSLGNTYFQCKPWLEGIPQLSWCVVEQETHVKRGDAQFADSALSFHASVGECAEKRPNFLLLSSVLQYLKAPFLELESLLDLEPESVLIDRTPTDPSGKGYLTVQEVPPEIYPASYPSWIFSRSELVKAVGQKYALLDEFLSLDRLDPAVEHRGFLFVRK
jgi:putative methyltransferase (TIGR04325 family)